MSSQTPTRPEIEVSEEALASLRDYLSRSGPAQLVRVHVGHG